MSRSRYFLWTLLLVFLAPAACALEGPITALEPLLGTWEVNAQWAGGQNVWSRAVYEEGIGGRTIHSRVQVRDGDGEPYQRYFAVFAYDSARETFIAHTFKRDGSYQAQILEVEQGVVAMEWTDGGVTIRDQSDLNREGRLRWTVQVRRPNQESFETIMDAVWRKLPAGDPETRPMREGIDTTLFDASGPGVRSFVKRTVIAAPVKKVYAAWTDGETFPAAYDPTRPELSANIELAIGGAYEWLWDGKLGSNGCQVLSFIPNRMVSFSWNAPPTQPESRAKHTWVVVEFQSTENGSTAVTLTHLGFGTAPHWDETYDYFSEAWPHVFEQFRKNLE